MKYALAWIYFLLLISIGAKAQEKYTVAFYNVENLMDTLDNPKASDNDFLPNGKYKWNTTRYRAKINALSTVISQIGSKNGPEIIGLAEVENKKVLIDLVNAAKLKNEHYEIVHFDSPDQRGIDVALLFKKKSFKLISSQAISVTFMSIQSHTRDIVLVKGKIGNDTLLLFVNHWPSRRKGTEATEDKRIGVALLLREKIDSILYKNKFAKIIVMGDFNDNPSDKSLQTALHSSNNKNQLAKNELYNPFVQLDNGTLMYHNKWNTFDQILISNALLHSSSNFQYKTAAVYSPSWLHYQNNVAKGPFRTFIGSEYKAGYSDHLPVFLQFEF